MTGVNETRKKSGEIYYRASFTNKNKHISLGSSSDEAVCHAMYNEACSIIGNPLSHWVDAEHRTASYNKAIDMLSDLVNITYTPNYIEGISSVEYASLYHNIILSKNFRNYVKSIS